MASTIGTIIDRLYRDYLEPPGEQPAQVALAANIDDSATEITFNEGYLSEAEEQALGAGRLIEINQELIRLALADPAGGAVTAADRGVLGTTAASHTAGDMIRILDRGHVTRLSAFEAVADAIENLSPTLQQVKTAEYTTAFGYIEVANDVEEVLAFAIPNTDISESYTRYTEAAVQFYRNAPWATTNERAIEVQGDIITGRTGHLIYLANLARPTDEDDTFADLGLEESWGTLIVLGAAVRLIAGADVAAKTQEFITEAVEMQGFPVGSGEKIDRALVRIYEYLLNQARKRFRLATGTTMVMEMMRPG